MNTENSPEKSQLMIDINPGELVKNGFLVCNNDKSDFNEQFRQIKRTVINKAFGTSTVARANDNANLVMVSSANKREGKTFVAVNMAISCALEKNKTVLLLDCNVINPQLDSLFNINCDKGLVGFLLGEVADLSEIIYSTSIPNLKIIPAGTPNFLTNELLASERMHILTNELSSRYPDRLVIVDSPELNGVSESSILASLMGQVILVAEAGKTPIHSLKSAKSVLAKHLEVGVVFNKKLA
jgi:protein-tyrosine kinase